MANYQAVLKRTLSGFGDPNPQLRSKLYDCARVTIRRQLEGRNPPLAGDALNAELQKLEEAIATVESEFNPNVDVAPVASEAVPNSPAPAAAAPVSQGSSAEPVEGWATEFANTVEEPATATVPAAEEEPPVQTNELPPVPPIPEIDFSAAPTEDNLIIPPVPEGADRSSGSTIGRLAGMVIAVLVLTAGLAYAWIERVQLLETVGLGHLVDNPTRPNPVKTIAIKPEPEPETVPEEVPPASNSGAPLPKEEDRLVPDSGGNLSEGTGNTETPTPPEATDPATLSPSTPAGAQTDNSSPTLAVAETAILYEEGASQAESTLDKGRVVWSVVQESPGDGIAAEPAIRARVEIPDRKLVLIMTIKRNADVALPASHLVELIFAVPDDFSGGAIESINRFVFKENEQSRGDALIAVPAKIADGIFLIALNNLQEAREQNTTFMKLRDWIDIPVQYKTGRRALVTLEKGIPGSAIFKEVFAAWDSASQ